MENNKGGCKMAKLYGKQFTKQELMKRIGDISQVAGAKQYVLASGKAKGVHAIDVKTGSGFSFTVLPDRGMDIAWAEYKGMALGFISKTGVVSPAYYEEPGLGFLRNFFAGLLTTCGLTYMGAPCNDEGQNLGLHRRVSNIPAEDVAVYNEWIDDEFIIKIRGKVRESRVFGENITLTREITAKLGENKLHIKDTVENCGFNEQPLMLLYHCNFGYPVVSTETILVTPEATVRARDAEAQKGIQSYNVFQEPTHGYREQVFYHDITADANGTTYACLFNKALGSGGMGAYVKFNKYQLPYLIEWKQMGEGDYVVGLEPGTWYPEGRAEARKRGELLFICPGEVKEFEIEIGVIESEKELDSIQSERAG
ncbi:MAG: hypothetical protein PWR27_1212 [Petroclostridium sp.]|nr:hypothetical protein [Petroclostridium sp.]